MENPARTGSVMQRDVWAQWPRSGYTPWEARGGVLPRPDLGTASRHDEGFFPRRLRGCPFPCRWPERAACLLTLSRSLEAAPGTGRTLGTVLREPLSAAGNQTLREGSLSSCKRRRRRWARRRHQQDPRPSPPSPRQPPRAPRGYRMATTLTQPRARREGGVSPMPHSFIGKGTWVGVLGPLVARQGCPRSAEWGESSRRMVYY